MVVESVIVLPLLFWAFAATWVFFDAFRALMVHERAAYTITDAVSRESSVVTSPYIDGLSDMLQMLSETRETPRLRVSVVRWDAEDERFYLVWSQVRNGGTRLDPLEDVDLEPGLDYDDQIPMAADGDRMIIVETAAGYQPISDVGLEPFEIDTFTAMRPRYAARRICFDPVGADDASDWLC